MSILEKLVGGPQTSAQLSKQLEIASQEAQALRGQCDAAWRRAESLALDSTKYEKASDEANAIKSKLERAEQRLATIRGALDGARAGELQDVRSELETAMRDLGSGAIDRIEAERLVAAAQARGRVVAAAVAERTARRERYIDLFARFSSRLRSESAAQAGPSAVSLCKRARDLLAALDALPLAEVEFCREMHSWANGRASSGSESFMALKHDYFDRFEKAKGEVESILGDLDKVETSLRELE